MKKLASALLCAVFSCLLLAGACAEGFSLDYFRSSGYYTVQEAEGYAFVGSAMGPDQLILSHADGIPQQPSLLSANLVVSGGGESQPVEQLFLWIDLYSAKRLDVHAVTFLIDGYAATYSDVNLEDGVTEVEGGWHESLMIYFGEENSAFLGAVAAKVTGRKDAAESLAVPMILHGKDENAAAVMGAGSMMDLTIMLNGLAHSGGSLSHAASATPVSVGRLEVQDQQAEPGAAD